MVPDSDGKLHLVDINSVDMEAEPAFNAPTDVIFRLWTRQNAGAGQIVRINNDADLNASNFVASRQTRFHVHGKKDMRSINLSIYYSSCGIY